MRRIGEAKWHELKRPAHRRHTRLPAPSAVGKIDRAVFYDGPIARAVAFEGLLSHGDRFIERLTGAFAQRDGAQLVHVATDGESYGHHHRFGDMALAYVLDRIGAGAPAQLYQLRRVLGKIPADRRSRNHREKLLELRPRHRSLVERLRLQLGRPSRLEPGVAHAAAQRAGLAARHHRAALGRKRARYSRIPGPPAMATSTSFTIDRRKTFKALSPLTPGGA